MKLTILGATGQLGSECLQQSVAAGHEVTVLVRSANKLDPSLAQNISVIEGDALVIEDIAKAIPPGTEAVLFAIGVDEKTSPPDLCTDVTKHVFETIRGNDTLRFIWCGGGSNLLEDDVITFGAKFVNWFSKLFLSHRHQDKAHQLEFLAANRDVKWFGVRPLQMKSGPATGHYRLGFNSFSGMSTISFADCAHAMLGMLSDDTWLGKAPIIQY